MHLAEIHCATKSGAQGTTVAQNSFVQQCRRRQQAMYSVLLFLLLGISRNDCATLGQRPSCFQILYSMLKTLFCCQISAFVQFSLLCALSDSAVVHGTTFMYTEPTFSIPIIKRQPQNMNESDKRVVHMRRYESKDFTPNKQRSHQKIVCTHLQALSRSHCNIFPSLQTEYAVLSSIVTAMAVTDMLCTRINESDALWLQLVVVFTSCLEIQIR